MKTMNKVLFCLLLLVFAADLAKAQVTVNTLLIPPTSNSINDFKSLAKVNVSFISPTTAFGIPQVTITGNNGITLTSNRAPNSYTSSVLTASVPVNITSTQLNQLFDVANLVATGLNSQQLQEYREFGRLPDGIYSVCFEFWSTGTAFIKISSPAPNGCATWIIGSGSPYAQSLREPPKTILPACQSNTTPVEPQQMLFTWLDPSAFSDLAKGPQQYILKMVEVPGNKSPYDAIATTSVPPFFQKTVFGTSYLYGLSDPPLKRGAKYAYVVSVSTDNRKYQNNGVSEVCWFTYGDTSSAKPAASSAPKSKAVKPGQVVYTPSKTFEAIPTTTIKGKLVYAFRKSETGSPGTGIDINVKDAATKTFNAGNAEKTAFLENGDFFLGNQQASSQTNSGIWESINEKSAPAASAGSAPVAVGSGNYSVQVGIAENTGSALLLKSVEERGWEEAVASAAEQAGTDRFPLSNSYVEVRLYMKNAWMQELLKMKKTKPFMVMPPNGILLGTAKTDNQGNFSITYNKGDINFENYYAELLVVNGTQFDFPAVPVPIDLGNFGEYDLGEILGLANTFRLKVNVIGLNGKKIETATVKVLRKGGFYTDKTYLEPEGNRFFGGNAPVEETKGSKKEEAPAASSPSSGTSVAPAYYGLESVMVMNEREVVASNNASTRFYRLFQANDASESYLLDLSAEDYIGGEMPLYFIPNGNLNFSGYGSHSSTSNGILSVTVTCLLQPEKPKVKGRVVDKTTEVPMPDITVTLANEDNSKIYTTKTGPDGRFLIKNIQASSQAYTLTLSGASIKEWTDPSKVVLETDGITVNRDPLYVSAILIPVMGVVSDLASVPLNNAELHWKNGGKSFYTASDGHYMGYNVPGKHTLVVSKPGFKSKEIQVELTVPPPKTTPKSPSKSPKGSVPSPDKPTGVGDIANQYGNILIGTVDGVNYSNPVPANTSKTKKTAGAGGNVFLDFLQQESKIDATLLGLLGSSNSSGSIDVDASLSVPPAFEYDKKPVNATLNDAKSGVQADVQGLVVSPSLSGVVQSFGPAVTLDTIKLSQFFVSVKVTDKDTKAPIANAVVTVNDDDKEYKTGPTGIAVLGNVPEGAANNIYVSAPPGTNYVAASASVAVQPSQDTTYVEVSMGGGAKLSGKVTAAGAAVAEAEVFVEGKAYIKTKTDADGNYAFGVPEGEYTIVAAKTGLVADKKSMTFEKKDYTQDFVLKDPGFDASKILGFDLILYDSKPGATPDEFKITGAITHIPSNILFNIPNSKKLEFFDQVVVKEGSNVVPKSGALNLADAQLDFKLFDYLNVNLKSAGGLKVKAYAGDNTKGSISGELYLDVSKTFGNKYGLTWPGGDYKLLGEGPGDFMAFYSGGALPVSAATLKLSAPASGWDIYGVKLTPDFNNTYVDKDGISFAGKIDLNDVPGLGAVSLNLKTFKIGTNGDIKSLEINLTPNPTISFLSWKLLLKNIGLNQYGLRFGGELTLPIPGNTDPAIFSFSDVNVNSSGLNGGTYSLKGNINFFGVADFNGLPGNPLSFSKIPGGNHYKINGGGTLKFSSFLNKAVDIQNFMVATNGEFGFTASPNLSFDFASGMANFKLNTIGFYPSKSEFSVDGGFGLNIPGIGAAASGSIHYAKSKVSVDKLGISASMGGIGAFSAMVEFGTDKFAGAGSIEIVDMIGMGMSFEYRKLPGGKLIKAQLSTSLSIPVGIVTFEKIGGGFMYNSAESKYGVNLTGRMVFATGTSALLALEKVVVGVEAQTSPPGARLYGSAEPYLLSTSVGHAEFEFSTPKKSFYVTATLGKSLNIIPGVGMSATGGMMLAACAQASDPYFLTGIYTKMNMLGLFNSNLNITAAWNLNRAAHPEFNDYTLFIPDAYLNSGKINGVHTVFNSLQGRLSDNPHCAGVAGIAELCAYAYADMKLNIHSNFATGTYGFGVSQAWGAGGSANFFDVGVAGANVGVGFGLNGAYAGGNWTINGNGSADAQAYIGCTGSGCGNGISWGCCFNACVLGCEVCPCPCGGKICVHPAVNVSYSSATGKFDLGLSW